MEEYDKLTETLALTMGASWASGINLYAAVAMLSILSITGNINLPEGLLFLNNPLVLMAAGIMFFVEFVVDKIPAADTGWDGIHTFIRIPAGALLAAGSVSELGPAVEVAAGILGGGLTTAVHATKSGSRALINTSPEPFTNWGASIIEDVMVFSGLWAALHHPTLFIAFMILFIIFMIWLLPKVWRGIKKVFTWIKIKFSSKTKIDKRDKNKVLIKD